MNSSPQIEKAKEIIASVQNSSLSTEKRREKAIELAALMLNEARRIQTAAERSQQLQLAGMMNDVNGKVFTTSMTDQCFRTQHSSRVANQLNYLLKKYGIPSYLSFAKQLALRAFQGLGSLLPWIFVPLTRQFIRQETSAVILPGEPNKLTQHMERRRQQGVRINLNHLGEAILGEDEAKRRLQIYLDDLAKPEVEYISIKISTICSQINLLAWEETLTTLIPRLKSLYRAAQTNQYTKPDGTRIPKFVNLDMEEYRDLQLTVDLFRRVLDDPEFFNHSAGIVLQSYLPDSYLIQQQLTIWAMQRINNGGAPIKIRIVKGANLAMEQVEAALRDWPQAPYTNKADVDANYKLMVNYGCRPEHARAAHLGIASHNLFDIAYTLLLRSENQVEKFISFEMLEGMADHMRRVVQTLAKDMLLYCPAATKEEFQNAVAYLVRRLDENTAPENFLRHAFNLIPGTKEWTHQANLFSIACHSANSVSCMPRRTQNRNLLPLKPSPFSPFSNEPDTDWSLEQNRKWAQNILQKWKNKTFERIPLVINGEAISSEMNIGKGIDPSYPEKTLYQYTLATPNQVDAIVETAVSEQAVWGQVSVRERSELLRNIAQGLRQHRDTLIGAMIADTGKTIYEADIEISEAIDFAEYYSRNLVEIHQLEDIEWRPKGPTLVAPPWNFPCSIPAGGLLAALAAGNTVIFKPASESILVGWELAKIFWEAGASKKVLQFLMCEDEPVGSLLIQDPRIACVVLTGATATAKLFMKLRPGLDLMAETGGKNAVIVSNMSDRDLAIKDIIQSAFGHSGQKCSACSLAILDAEVYDDPHFRQQLKDAAASLKVGSPWNPASKINPLIRPPGETLVRGLTQLDSDEEWLLEPKQDAQNPHLWSPGIRWGVQPGSYSHQNEFFGPVLSVMRANDLEDAIRIANGSAYGLTSGLQSLDDREQGYWMEHIEAGNCYINRGITGAIVQRQPFGGTKESSFGRGSKAGGPNYLSQLMHPTQFTLPSQQETPPQMLDALTHYFENAAETSTEVEDWKASVGSYTYFYNSYFSKKHDSSRVLGQDNFLKYVPHKQITLRIQGQDRELDILRVIAGCIICQTPVEISAKAAPNWLKFVPEVTFVQETESEFLARAPKRVRLVSPPSVELRNALANSFTNVIHTPVLANGRLELLNYLREVSLSIDYHRYGNLGDRENEKRTPLPLPRSGKCGPQCCCIA